MNSNALTAERPPGPPSRLDQGPGDHTLSTEFGVKRTLEERTAAFSQDFARAREGLQKVIVGLDQETKLTLGALLAGGHVLLEGDPGLGKTLLAKSIGATLGLDYKRVQFTPDLMPSDITGSMVLRTDERGRNHLQFDPGPIFTNILLADEINRASPKTQSALLEAMGENQVSNGRNTYQLSNPFIVLATQNPLEHEGTYPLPEAQRDRFLVHIKMKPCNEKDQLEILRRFTNCSSPVAAPVFSPDEAVTRIGEAKELAAAIKISDELMEKIAKFTTMLHPAFNDAVKKNVLVGPGPRGSLAVARMAKAMALFDGRAEVMTSDIEAVCHPCIDHRMILTSEGEASSSAAKLVDEAFKSVFKS